MQPLCDITDGYVCDSTQKVSVCEQVGLTLIGSCDESACTQ